MNSPRLLSIGALIAVVMAAPGAALAEPLEQRAAPPRRERPAPPEAADRDLRPIQPHVPHRPAFIEGLSKRTRNGRVGIAGWTAPNAPNGARGAADPEHAGVFGGGVAAEWRN